MHIEPHILIVDDDLQIRKLLGRYLAEQGFRITLASDRRTLEAALEFNDIKLIVLDVMLPDGSGLDICRDMRAENSPIPVILLTALKEDVDRIIGLEIGADDYLGKPFNPRELAARIRAVLRRQNDGGQILRSPEEYRFEGFRLQPQLRRVLNPSGELLDLTSAELTSCIHWSRGPDECSRASICWTRPATAMATVPSMFCSAGYAESLATSNSS